MNSENKMALFQRADDRLKRALHIIHDLDLINLWSRLGQPEIVGSVKMGLVVAQDIDLEVYSDNPRISDGFQVMAKIAESDNVVGIVFKNEIDTRGKWLYWEIHYRDDDATVWNIEIYFCSPGDPYAHFSARFASAMKESMTDEHRVAILSIKEVLSRQKIGEKIKSFDVYRAVLDGGVRSLDEFMKWLEKNRTQAIVPWVPGTKKE